MIKEFLGPKLGSVQLMLKERQPELFLAGGIGLGIFAAVKLAQAHKNSEEVFEDVKGEIDGVNGYVDFNNDLDEEFRGDDWEEIPRKDKYKALTPLYLEAAKRGAIHYGPSLFMGAGAIGLIITSHRSLKARNKALVGLAALLQESFSKYRSRVVDEYGKEVDERFYYGAEVRKVNTVTVGKDGKKRKGKKEDKNHIPEEPSPMMYQRTFDEFNVNWRNGDELNLWWLTVGQEHFNTELQNKGWVPLNSVYEYLGFPRTSYGQVVGWSLEKGDGYVDFGLDADINQREGDVRYILDFNVCGYLLDALEE